MTCMGAPDYMKDEAEPQQKLSHPTVSQRLTAMCDAKGATSLTKPATTRRNIANQRKLQPRDRSLHPDALTRRRLHRVTPIQSGFRAEPPSFRTRPCGSFRTL